MKKYKKKQWIVFFNYSRKKIIKMQEFNDEKYSFNYLIIHHNNYNLIKIQIGKIKQ